MSKTEKATDVQGAEVANTEENNLPTINGVSNLDKMLEGLEDANVSSVTLNAESKEFEDGEVLRCIFAAHSTMTFSGKDDEEDKTKNAIKFVDKTGKVYICASTSLVNACKDLVEGTPIEITCTGEVKMKRGKMKTFDVRLLQYKK